MRVPRKNNSIMDNQIRRSNQWVTIGGISGIVANFIFVILITCSLPIAIEIFLIGMFGILFSICGFGIHHLLKYERPTILSEIAGLFIFISGVLFNLMLVVQQVSRGYLSHFTSQSLGPNEYEILKWIEKSLDTIHLAMQLSNDFFYGTAMFLFSVIMFKHSAFGKAWSISGIGIALMLFIVKCYSFPFTPQEIGIPFFLGPLVSLWFVLVCIQCLRKRHKLLEIDIGSNLII